MDYSLPDSSVHGDFPVKDTGLGYHFLLQGIFVTQGLNLSFLQVSHAADEFFDRRIADEF